MIRQHDISMVMIWICAVTSQPLKPNCLRNGPWSATSSLFNQKNCYNESTNWVCREPSSIHCFEFWHQSVRFGPWKRRAILPVKIASVRDFHGRSGWSERSPTESHVSGDLPDNASWISIHECDSNESDWNVVQIQFLMFPLRDRSLAHHTLQPVP
jgi:hypothetical protein